MENESKYRVRVIRTIVQKQIIDLETWATGTEQAKKQALIRASQAEEIDLKTVDQVLKIESIYHFDVWS